MWLFVDSYDSFSHILIHYIQLYHNDLKVIKCDELSLAEIIALAPERIILGPGPGHPKDAKHCKELAGHFIKIIPILGICLGHQVLGLQLGAECARAQTPMHGKVDIIEWYDSLHPMSALSRESGVMRYHSLIITEFDEKLRPLAFSNTTGELMAFSHDVYPCIGLQFHPESILTENGLALIEVWCAMDFSEIK